MNLTEYKKYQPSCRVSTSISPNFSAGHKISATKLTQSNFSALRNLGDSVRHLMVLAHIQRHYIHARYHYRITRHRISTAMPQRESSDVSSAGSPPAPKRRRRRPARSCEQCRRRKIRCSLGQPCNGCVRARAPMQCSYRDGSPVVVTRGSEVFSSVPAERTESQGPDTATQRSREAHHRSPVNRPPQPENSDRTVSNSHSYLPRTIPAPQTPTPAQSSTSIPPFTPRLRHVPEKTKLFGQTHWLHTAEKVNLKYLYSSSDTDLHRLSFLFQVISIPSRLNHHGRMPNPTSTTP